MRVALFTLESLANAAAVRCFVADHATEIGLVALSNPYRRSAGGMIGQTIRHLRRSGPRFLPYLIVNFLLPDLVGSLRRIRRQPESPEKTRLRNICRLAQIPVVTVEDVASARIHAELIERKIDLIVSFHFDQIFDAATLAIPRLGGINVHPSLLPRHRGPVPTLYALLETPPVFGVTVHRLAEKIDAGDIIAQREVTMPKRISALGVARYLHEEGRELLETVLRDLAEGRTAARPSETLPYCPFPSPTLLREAAHRDIALADWNDVRAAFGMSP